jgi:hypothetical protein
MYNTIKVTHQVVQSNKTSGTANPHLDGGEDSGERSGRQKEDSDGGQLTGVTLLEVGDGLDQLAHDDHRDVGSLKSVRLGSFTYTYKVPYPSSSMFQGLL